MKNFQTLLISIIALLSGGATVFSFAPFYHYYLAPLLFLVLLVLYYYFPRHRSLYTYLWAFAAFFGQCYWIHTALTVFGGIPEGIALFSTLLLPLFLALFPLTASFLARLIHWPIAYETLVAFPITWILCDFARSHFWSGFGWGTLGYSQAAVSPLAGYAPVGGVLLVSLAVVITAALLLGIWIVRRSPLHLSELVLALIFVALGGEGLKHVSFTRKTGEISRIALVQPNIPQEAKFNSRLLDHYVEGFLNLIDQYPGVDILLFPETSIPAIWENLSPSVRQAFTKGAQKNNTALALGLFKLNPETHHVFNALIVIDPQERAAHPGTQLPFYAKHHLVPFGETPLFPALTHFIFTALNLDFSPIDSGKESQGPFKMAHQWMAFNICYEELFGDELISGARDSTLIANGANMAWYGSSYAMDQQLQQAQMRAMELGRYLVRATNTGYSAIIDHKGHILQKVARDHFGVLVDTIPGFQGETPYMRLGGDTPCAIFLLVIYLVLFFIRPSFKSVN